MITMTNYASGTVNIAHENGLSLLLTRDQAHRLIMAARMHSPDDFIPKIESLVQEPQLARSILNIFEEKTASERWTLKEKFARLHSVAKGFIPDNPKEVIEVIEFTGDEKS
jgi:hypothetical protein